MKAPKSIQVFEYETLRVGQKEFTLPYFERLAAFQEERQTPFYSLGHKSIRFSHYVGVLQVHDLMIEVLPKTGKIADKDLWRDVLLEMLKVSGFLNVQEVSKASLALRGGTLLPLFFEVFLSYSKTLLWEGLVRGYQQETANRKALRGRILFSGHIKNNLIRKERFYTESQNYSEDNIYNQILFKALGILSLVSSRSAQRKDASLLLQQNDGISDISCSHETFSRLTYNRTTERYRSALNLAELIILNYQPDLKSGLRSVLAILFPMESLFESYVTSVLKKASQGTPFKVSSQKGKHFWRGKEGGLKTIRPDIIIHWSHESETRRVILDTKWKTPGSPSPGDNDLKQMFVYNKFFESKASSLVYPAAASRTSKHEGKFVGKENGECSLWYVQILDKQQNKLNPCLGKEMLEVLSTDQKEDLKGAAEGK